MKKLFGLIMVIGTLLSANAYAIKAGDPLEFDAPEQKELYGVMLHELRCTVRQNQSLAGSNAALAEDLRTHLYKMVTRGDDKEQIQNFMVERYGEFVLYRPAFSPANYLLWIGPFVLLLLGVIVLRLNISSRSKMVREENLTDAEREKLSNYLDSDKEKS